VFYLTLGLHPGLQTFHPSGIQKERRGRLSLSRERKRDIGVSINPGFTPRATNISSLRDSERETGQALSFEREEKRYWCFN